MSRFGDLVSGKPAASAPEVKAVSKPAPKPVSKAPVAAPKPVVKSEEK